MKKSAFHEKMRKGEFPAAITVHSRHNYNTAGISPTFEALDWNGNP
jgi:hypothetical protein